MMQLRAPRPFSLALAIALTCVALLAFALGDVRLAYADDAASALVSGTSTLEAEPAVEEADSSAEETSAPAPSNSKEASKAKAADSVSAKPVVAYKVYSKGKGWPSGWKKSGKTAGATSARIQIAKLKVNKDGLSGGISYRVKMYGKKWSSWTANGKAAGAKGVAMMGIRIKLTGKLSKYFDVAYRVYHAEDGWLPWVVNGAVAGCRGSLGINQLQVKLVKKGATPGLSDGAYLISQAKDSTYLLSTPAGDMDAGARLVRAKYEPTAIGERIYLRNEDDGTISLQSVMSGKFIGERKGKVVLGADADSASYRWKLAAWDGGYVVANASSGKKLNFAGKKAAAGSGKSRWVFSATKLIGDGNYELVNNAQENELYLEDMSFADKANVELADDESGEEGARSFRFTNKGAETYRIDNAASFKAIEVAGGSKSDGANVRQAKWKNSKAQLWKAKLTRQQGLVFTNKASGKVLTASDKGKEGANVVSSKASGLATQAWSLRPSSYVGSLGIARAVEKTADMHSSTSYLIAVDLTNHWLTIFKGSKGNWKIYKNWQVSNGKPSTPTVVGNFTVGIKQYVFGHGYSCYYATQFYGDYLFHSVKYHEGTRRVQDGRLGQSISMGCVRMKIENAKWIYDNIPSGTAVKTFR